MVKQVIPFDSLRESIKGKFGRVKRVRYDRQNGGYRFDVYIDVGASSAGAKVMVFEIDVGNDYKALYRFLSKLIAEQGSKAHRNTISTRDVLEKLI